MTKEEEREIRTDEIDPTLKAWFIKRSSNTLGALAISSKAQKNWKSAMESGELPTVDRFGDGMTWGSWLAFQNRLLDIVREHDRTRPKMRETFEPIRALLDKKPDYQNKE